MKQNITIIHGERGEGKTTFIKSIVAELKANNITFGGLMAEGFWKEGVRDRFDLVNIMTGDKLLYCQRDRVEGWEKIVHFYVNPAGDKFGNEVLKSENLKGVNIVIIDEIGPFELQRKGWARSIFKICKELDVPMLWVVRNHLVEEVIDYFDVKEYQSFDISQSKPKEVAIYIKEKILNR